VGCGTTGSDAALGSLVVVNVFMVVGAQRTGSTLLATTLGMIPGATIAGELRLLWPSLAEGRPCACLQSAPLCPVWARVVENVLRSPGLAGVTISELAALNAESLRQRHLATFLAGRIPTELEPLATATTALYRALSEVHGVSTIIDSSKSPAFYAFVRVLTKRADAELTLRGVHLVRDPRGVVDSWSTDKVWKRDGWSEELLAKPARQAIKEWTMMNVGAELARVSPRVRFEDFTREPERIVRMLTTEAGLRQPAAAELPILDGAVVVRDNHAIGGNVDRFDTGPVLLRTGEGWRQRVDPGLQRKLLLLARRYGYR
jgi:Sulfotransferase family